MGRILVVWAFCTLAASSVHTVRAQPPEQINQQGCQPSETIYKNDLALLLVKPPTFFRLMPSRYFQMVEAARGMACTGTVTVSYNGRQFIQAGRADDAGIAELIPLISSWTGLSLGRSFDFLAFTVIIAGTLIGYSGFWRMYPEPGIRSIGFVAFVSLSVAEGVIANVHLFQSSPLIAGIPWMLLLARKTGQRSLNIGAMLFAFCCTWCSFVRIGSWLFCMVFLTTLFLCRGPRKKALLSLVLIALASIPTFALGHLFIARRNALLNVMGNPSTVEDSHTIWHSIYIGLAFVPNPEIPRYDDEIAINRARSIDPAAVHTSAAYDAILRREVFSIARRRPLLILLNVMAKSAIVLLLAAALLFPVRAKLMEKEDWWVDASFITTMIASSMNAVLVSPRPPYLLTFVCVTTLYSLIRFSDGRSMANIHPETSGRGTLSAIATLT